MRINQFGHLLARFLMMVGLCFLTAGQSLASSFPNYSGRYYYIFSNDGQELYSVIAATYQKSKDSGKTAFLSVTKSIGDDGPVTNSIHLDEYTLQQDSPFIESIGDLLHISDRKLELDFAGDLLEVNFSDPVHWNERKPNASPIGLLEALPMVKNKWRIKTMGSSAQYFVNKQIKNGTVFIEEYQGTGLSDSFSYLMAADESSTLVLAGGKQGFPVEMWIGQVKFGEERFKINSLLRTKRTMDACKGRFELSTKSRGKTLRISAKTDAFYFDDMPSRQIYGYDYDLQKSRNAEVTITILDREKTIYQKYFPRAVMEFGGGWVCQH